MKVIHFEIGHVFNRKWNQESRRVEHETTKVFGSTSLREVIKEYKDKGYTEPNYFIDVWETDDEGIPYPLADIKLEHIQI